MYMDNDEISLAIFHTYVKVMIKGRVGKSDLESPSAADLCSDIRFFFRNTQRAEKMCMIVCSV